MNEAAPRVRIASLVAVSVTAFGIAGCGGGEETGSTEAAHPGPGATQTSNLDAGDFFGATLGSTTAGEPGAVVLSVKPDSKSRLKRGDVILTYNGTRVESAAELIGSIGTPKVGEQFTIRVVRGSHRFTLTEVQSATAYLGVNVRDGAAGGKGAVVVSTTTNGPAATAGLRRGDLITALDDTPVGSVDDLLQIIGSHAPGEEIKVSVSRGSRRLEVTATLTTRPAPDRGR